MNILITGASGFIGRHLIKLFHENDIHVIALTRNKSQFNDSWLQVIEHLAAIPNDYPVDAIINLAGAPIDRRWSERYKRLLLDSRLDVTQSLYHLVKRLAVKPKTIISASAVGYYGNQGDTPIFEQSDVHHEFTHELCEQWEQAALNINTLNTRVLILRLGVVLGKNCRMLKKILPSFYMGLGGKIGSGTQYISWVHIHDVLSAIMFLLESQHNSAIYNLTSPFPVTNAEWTTALARVLNRPAWLTIPKTAVRLLFGNMGETLLLNGQKVLPHNLLEAGFTFKYQKLNEALEAIVKPHDTQGTLS